MLLRDFGHLSRSFHSDASYVWLDEAARQGVDFAMHGPQFSRGFAALKVWISLLAHGTAAYARRIAHDARLAAYLGELVEEHPDFELMGPPRLSICCFRYRPRDFDGDEAELDRLNERLMTAIHVDGRAYCSNAVIDGRFGLRMHRELPHRGRGRGEAAGRRGGARGGRPALTPAPQAAASNSPRSSGAVNIATEPSLFSGH